VCALALYGESKRTWSQEPPCPPPQAAAPTVPNLSPRNTEAKHMFILAFEFRIRSFAGYDNMVPGVPYGETKDQTISRDYIWRIMWENTVKNSSFVAEITKNKW
jgi:hypothetical protein